jgi:hypothetical protein
VLFFVGGRTLAYDPKTRQWSDLKPGNVPTACGSLVWASLCYDPVNDEAVLFGGGMALNLWGGAYTWLYDCEQNTWRALNQPRAEQPPPRCNTQTAFDAENGCIVLFGGDAQSKFLADTWVYDAKARKWVERKPDLSPPPAATCGMTYVTDKRLVLMVGGLDNTWTYDVAANTWTRIKGHLGLGKKDHISWSTGFMSCAYSTRDNLALLLGLGGHEGHSLRRTWLYRLEPENAAHPQQKGVAQGTSRYRLDEFPRLEEAPPPDRTANPKRLAELPANTMVEAKPPATVTAKTWSTATIDTDRGEVIYTGGGHSGYSGNDWAHYSVADNRWSMGFPPKAAPYLWACSVGPYGWSYDAQPWSTHTRHTYQYDPQSKTCVYLGRQHDDLNGQEIWLSDRPEEAFRYELKKDGLWQWVYDPAAKRLHPPTFGSPLRKHDRSRRLIGFIGTPHGLYLTTSGGLWRGTVSDGKCRWEQVDQQTVPRIAGDYEVHPLVYDSKRDRLLQLWGKGLMYHPGQNRGTEVNIFAYPFAAKKWERLETTGYAEISRDALYIEKHDTLLLLGKEKWLALDCRENEWRVIDCTMPKANYGWDSAAVYDPVHDAAVALLPDRFSGPMRVYLFRYNPATATYRRSN